MMKTVCQPFLKGSKAGKSVLVGAPVGYSFLQGLQSASCVRVAMAFGHMTGWRAIEAALQQSRARKIEILLGVAFFQTEPALLKLLLDWQDVKKCAARLAPSQTTFHPKVWIITAQDSTHAIVGSANLSNGGLVRNTECSAYLGNSDDIESLNTWFDQLWQESSPLTTDICQMYEAKYLSLLQTRNQSREAIRAAIKEWDALQSDWKKDEAIKEARQYLASDDGRAASLHRVQAMEQIRKCLKPPTFQFSKADWLEFLSIHEFGSMKRIRRNTVDDLPRIKKAFLYLADESVSISSRIDAVVPNRSTYHVPGIGMNIATKVLAMLKPAQRPVYNQPVADTLGAFGYEAATKGSSDGMRYNVFCDEMGSFVKECGLSEMLTIDSFFEYYANSHKS